MGEEVKPYCCQDYGVGKSLILVSIFTGWDVGEISECIEL